jgi:hypothetical protein
MDVRKKLVEIIQNSVGGCARHWAEVIADFLIANGVTVQKWIPVTERLPDVAIRHNSRWEKSTESVRVLCVCKQKSGKRMVKEGCCKVYANGIVYWAIPGAIDSVTHWMPLPEPPKGE